MTNPQTLETTDSFVFQTLDENFNLIDISTSTFALTMDKPALLKKSTVLNLSPVNGVLSDYLFTLVPAINIG